MKKTISKSSNKLRIRNPDPFETFVCATAYWKAAAALGRELKVKAPYNIPVFVVEAFSLELHLKCLLRIERKRLSNTHEPKDLYKKLTPRHRRLIREYAAKKPSEMRSILDRADGVFKKLRYLHEGHQWPTDQKNQWGNSGFNDVVHAIRRIIKERNPTWDARKNLALGLKSS